MGLCWYGLVSYGDCQKVLLGISLLNHHLGNILFIFSQALKANLRQGILNRVGFLATMLIGIQAQTVSTFHQAFEADLEVNWLAGGVLFIFCSNVGTVFV